MSDILVIGGSNIDFSSRSDNPLIRGDSNIGKRTISFGGVGRNVCENLAHLHDSVSFITAIGKDSRGQERKKSLEKRGIKTYVPDLDYPSGSYNVILDSNGNRFVAICETSFLDHLRGEDRKPFDSLIRGHEYIVLEANRNQNVINYLFDTYPDKKFLVETVSANKVSRFVPHLSQIYLFKSNVLESKYALNEEKDPISLAKDLIERGVKNVVISNGPRPITFGNKDSIEQRKVVPRKDIASENGAGDALFSGILHSLHQGKSLKEAVAFGSLVSERTLNYPGACNPDIGKLVK